MGYMIGPISLFLGLTPVQFEIEKYKREKNMEND
jgi:hypothetical protein